MTDSLDAGVFVQSRRAALLAGGGMLAALGARALPGAVRAQATPEAEGAGLVLVQSFSKGTLFPTQGDADSPPFTIYLWEAADRGLLFVSGGELSFVPTDSLLIAIDAGERPQMALVVPAQADGEPAAVWALRMGFAGRGSDPDSMTYQGEPLDEAEVAAWLGMTPMPLPDGAQDLAPGYLVVAGLPGLDIPEVERVRVALS